MKIKVKICGLTSVGDALMAAKAGADYLGFIVDVEKSPRNLTPTEVKKIILAVKKEFPLIRCVGVLIDKNFEEIKKIIKVTEIDIVQLHGNESPELCDRLRDVAEVWKAVLIKSANDLDKMTVYKTKSDKILLDAGRGSGKLINLELLKGISVNILAGGLGMDNVEVAIKEIQPQVVDLNSRLELIPGKKDLNLVQQTINLIKI